MKKKLNRFHCERHYGIKQGKQIISDTNLTKGPIDPNSLSPIEPLNLAALAQAKASEDLLKSHTEDKELISILTSVLEKILPSFKQDSIESPSNKLRSMLKLVDSHFVSLANATEAKVLSQFNAMRLRIILRMIEGDRASLITNMKGIQDGLEEGGKIYKSCLLLPKFTIDLDKKTKECEGQLVGISQCYGP